MENYYFSLSKPEKILKKLLTNNEKYVNILSMTVTKIVSMNVFRKPPGDARR